MESAKHIHVLQMVYAGALADMTLQLGREGVLSRVTERKRREQFAVAAARAAQFGISRPEEVFRRLSEIFACAAWEIVPESPGGFLARTAACALCAAARKIGAPSPCRLYCLDPMEGLVKAVKGDAVFTVEQTLWDGDHCRVRVA